jgi:gas vesicle protein
MNTTGKVLVGLLAGAAAGAILGVLFAPDKGSETRRKIATKSKDIKDDVKEKFTDFLENVKEKFDTKTGHNHGHKENVKEETA